jgi:hypothetical protein
MNDMMFTPGVNFRLDAERKQRAYAEQRRIHTDTQLRAFMAWQAEVTAVRRRLFGLIAARSRTRPPAPECVPLSLAA